MKLNLLTGYRMWDNGYDQDGQPFVEYKTRAVDLKVYRINGQFIVLVNGKTMTFNNCADLTATTDQFKVKPISIVEISWMNGRRN